MSRLEAATIGICSLLMASVACGQATPTFESLDKNADGQISIQEATSHDDVFVAFKKLDTNKDGQLSKAEFAAHAKK